MRVRFALAIAAAAFLAACGSGGGGSGSQPHTDPNPNPGPSPGPDPGPGPGPGPDPAVADTVLQCARDFLASYVAGGTRNEPIPPSCATPSSTSSICCPNHVPMANCGPLALDFTVHAGDAARLAITQPDASTLGVTLRAREWTVSPAPVTIPGVGDCALTGNTTHGSYPDVALSFVVARSTVGGTPHLVVSSPALSRLEAADLSLSGSVPYALTCSLANNNIPSQLSALSQNLADGSVQQITAEMCAVCPCGI